MEKELMYEAPEVEILEIEVERGFATSDEFDANGENLPWG